MDKTSELDRRITHVENETVHIYDLIEQRAAEVRLRFDAVDARFDAVDARFDAVEQTLAEILRRLPEPA